MPQDIHAHGHIIVQVALLYRREGLMLRLKDAIQGAGPDWPGQHWIGEGPCVGAFGE